MTFVFYLFQSLSVTTIYLGCVSNLIFPTRGGVKWKILQIMGRFALAQGELKKPTYSGRR